MSPAVVVACARVDAVVVVAIDGFAPARRGGDSSFVGSGVGAGL